MRALDKIDRVVRTADNAALALNLALLAGIEIVEILDKAVNLGGLSESQLAEIARIREGAKQGWEDAGRERAP